MFHLKKTIQRPGGTSISDGGLSLSPRLLYMLLLVLNVYAIYSFVMLAMRPEGDSQKMKTMAFIVVFIVVNHGE